MKRLAPNHTTFQRHNSALLPARSGRGSAGLLGDPVPPSPIETLLLLRCFIGRREGESFINSAIIETFYMRSTVLGARDTVVNKIRSLTCGANVLVGGGERGNTQVNKIISE